MCHNGTWLYLLLQCGSGLTQAQSTLDVRMQILTQILWCCLRAVWTILFTSTGPICLRCACASCVDEASRKWALVRYAWNPESGAVDETPGAVTRRLHYDLGAVRQRHVVLSGVGRRLLGPDAVERRNDDVEYHNSAHARHGDEVPVVLLARRLFSEINPNKSRNHSKQGHFSALSSDPGGGWTLFFCFCVGFFGLPLGVPIVRLFSETSAHMKLNGEKRIKSQTSN